MHLTELQKSFVIKINNLEINGVKSFFASFCEFKTQEVNAMISNANENYLSLDIEGNRAKCKEFINLIHKLHNNGLIELISETSKTTFLVFQSEDVSDKPAQIDGKLISLLGEFVQPENKEFRFAKEIIPLPELSEFIRHDYRTIDEYHNDEKIKTSEKSQKITRIVSIMALATAIIFNSYLCYRNTQQDQKVEGLEYKNDSMNHRPRLEIIAYPFIESIAFKPVSIKAAGEFLNAYSKLRFRVTLKFKNTGNSTGRVLALIHADTLSGYDNIRAILLSDRRNTAKFNVTPWKEFFPIKEILPSDTTIFEIDHELDFVSNAQAVFHFLIFYENELNNLYDTYYWARFRLNPVIVGIMKHTMIDSAKMLIKTDVAFARRDLQNAIIFQDGNQSMYLYNKEERSEILKFLEAQARK
jgi:hypothetical protein